MKATASDVDGTRSETKTGIDGTDNRGCKNEDGYEENDWFVSLIKMRKKGRWPPSKMKKLKNVYRNYRVFRLTSSF